MPMSSHGSAPSSVIESLYIEALRQGQTLWFQVVSGSMSPLLRIGDAVCIESTRAHEILPGQIAAFEASERLVIHRIIRRQFAREDVRLLQMGDTEPRANWLDSQVVVGRVVAIRRGSVEVDLRCAIARWGGFVTAFLRYQYYKLKKIFFVGIVLRKFSRLAACVISWLTCNLCASSLSQVPHA